MKILFDGYVTHENLGIYSSVPMQRYLIFDQGISNICGFKEVREAWYDEELKGEFVEIKLFMKLVFDGFPIPYYILNTPPDSIEAIEDEFREIMALHSGGTGCLPVTKDMVFSNVGRLETFLKQLKNKKVIPFSEIINNCILSELLRKVVISGRFELEKKEFIQGLANQRLKGFTVDHKSCEKFIKDNLKSIKQNTPGCSLREGLSKMEIHELLLKLRGIK